MSNMPLPKKFRETVREFQQAIAKKTRERDVLMDQLRLWTDIMAQGIDPDDVEAFGFDLKLAPKEERDRIPPVGTTRRDAPEWFGPWVRKRGEPLWFNYVKRTDGTRVTLNPAVRAAPRLPDQIATGGHNEQRENEVTERSQP